MPAMKVAIIFATDGSDGGDEIIAPFATASFAAGLRLAGFTPLMIAAPHGGATSDETFGGADLVHSSATGLRDLIAGERPDAIQTFGMEMHLAGIWPMATALDVPVAHCVSSWRGGDAQTRPVTGSVFAAAQAKRASRHVGAVIGTSRAAAGRLIAAGWFSGAAFSVILPPPVERSGAAPAPRAAGGEPVFGIYDPGAPRELFAFVAHAIDLTGRRDNIRIRVAAKHPPREVGPMTVVEAAAIDEFLATLDVLVVPAYRDAAAPALIAALRAGKSVIVPDCGGAAELIEYGRHGVMFAAGSAYHLANAINLIGQSWQETPVLLAEGGPAIARTHPTIVAQGFAEALQRLVSARSQQRVAGTSHG
jgi:hypothetical protein